MKNRLLAGIAHRPESTMVHLASYTKEVERVESHPEAQQGMVGVPGWKAGWGPCCSECEEQTAREGALGCGRGVPGKAQWGQARSSREVAPTALGTRERGGGGVEGGEARLG